MAQDFYSAFGVGEDNRHITSIDEDGVALAAIKGLDAKLDSVHRQNGQLRSENLHLNRATGELHREIGELHGSNTLLQSRLAALEAKVDALVPAAKR